MRHKLPISIFVMVMALGGLPYFSAEASPQKTVLGELVRIVTRSKPATSQAKNVNDLRPPLKDIRTRAQLEDYSGSIKHIDKAKLAKPTDKSLPVLKESDTIPEASPKNVDEASSTSSPKSDAITAKSFPKNTDGLAPSEVKEIRQLEEDFLLHRKSLSDHLNNPHVLPSKLSISPILEGFEEILQKTNAILARHPENVHALILSGRAQLQLKRYNQAFDTAEKVLKMDPENAQALSLKAEIKADSKWNLMAHWSTQGISKKFIN